MVSKCQGTCRRPHCLWRSSFPSSGQRQGRFSRSESFVRLFVEQTPKKSEPVHRLQATVRLSAIVGILLLYTRKRIKTVPVEKDKATSCDSLLCASFGGSSRCASFPPLAHSHPLSRNILSTVVMRHLVLELAYFHSVNDTILVACWISVVSVR